MTVSNSSSQQDSLVRVAFNLPAERLFTYILPPGLRERARPGQRVSAPFGQGRRTGYLVDLNAPLPEEGFELKAIAEILDPEPLFDEHLLALSRWISRYYCCPWGMVLDSCLPPGLKGKSTVRPQKERSFELALGPKEAALCLESLPARAQAQRALLQFFLQRQNHCSAAFLRRQPRFSRSALQALVDKGILRAFSREVESEIYYGRDKAAAVKPRLTPHQARTLRSLEEAQKQGEYTCLLLHGITGSGKTEVYLRAIEGVLERGLQALVLVPEISLTPQLVERFRARFGSRIALLHSQLNNRERLQEWRRLRRGEARIGIGVRAAVLTPLPDLGLIVVDEEHENSYKQDKHPRYHARDVAIMRAKMLNIPVLVGSATPSLESYYNTEQGKAGLLCLPERIGKSTLPAVEVVDLRQIKNESGPPLFSPLLLDAVAQRLERGEQSLLFLNRRGHFSCALCRECGESLKCPQCSVSLTYHSHGDLLRCHYCDFIAPPAGECPHCKGALLTYSGLGTQRVEKELRAIFPQARVLRMDRDSSRQKNAYWDFFEALEKKQVDIVLGTQMVSKGLDLPGITLVGVIAADLILNFPDFRAAERTFQLLTQVAGRAGRGAHPGQAVIQSFIPEHYSIRSACRHDYQGFYAAELYFRKALGYPPFNRIANLLLRGRREEEAQKTAKRLVNYLHERKIKGLRIMGAAPAPLSRIRGEYRWQVLLKAPAAGIMHQALGALPEFWNKTPDNSRLRLDIDMDALNLM